VSQETATFKKELEKLDNGQKEMTKAETDLSNFISSKEFLTDRNKFLELLGKFQSSLVTLAEAATQPIAGLPPPNPYVAAEGAGAQEDAGVESEKTFTIEKSLVIVVCVVACAIIVEQLLLPPISLVAVIVGALGFTFYPQLRNLVVALLSKGAEEEEEEGHLLEDWINESLSKIRQEYMGARIVVKFQPQNKDSLPEYMTQGVDAALYDRSEYFAETLPVEFLSRIGRIVVQCDRNVWSRRVVIVHAIEMAKQAEVGVKST
jgi:hypothetical protein